VDLHPLQAHRRPLNLLEAQAIRNHLRRPDELSPLLMDGLRYTLSFARLHTIEAEDGAEVDVSGMLAPLRAQVLDRLGPHLDGKDDTLWGAVRELPALVQQVRHQRERLLRHYPLDRDSLEAEVTTRQLVVASGGGGGGGYGYAGAFRSLHRAGLQPELMAGTSIGALMSMFRARFKVFDGAALIAAARRLSWSSVFRVLEMESRYGIPASLRLYLRAALGTLFEVDGARQMTFRDVEIPLLVVTTGITVDALKHDLSYYEHFLDDVERPGAVFRRGRLRRLAKLGEVLREFMSRPESLREIVFGADPHTMDADILDAAGFSAAVPGVIHYDVVRDDQRMKQLLDTLYAEYGITRLTEGGLVNNLPARPAWLEATQGRLKRRNPFVLAMDCFAPSRRSLQWLPIQQIVRPNVKANLEYADFYFALDRRLSPVNLVPDVAAVSEAMQWTTDELAPDLPFIQESCRPIAVLPLA
jgi:predicted acylesterase/phospholipase RssA